MLSKQCIAAPSPSVLMGKMTEEQEHQTDDRQLTNTACSCAIEDVLALKIHSQKGNIICH